MNEGDSVVDRSTALQQVEESKTKEKGPLNMATRSKL